MAMILYKEGEGRERGVGREWEGIGGEGGRREGRRWEGEGRQGKGCVHDVEWWMW